MKTKLSIICGLILSIIISCSDDDMLGQNSDLTINSNKKIELINLPHDKNSRQISNYSGKMLSFATLHDFENTLRDLEEEMRLNSEYINNIIGPGVTNEDVIEQYFIDHHLDEFKPLVDFEIYYGHLSLRKNIWDLESQWLSHQGDIFDSHDPDNHYISDIYIRTLLNIDSEVMIEGKIYRFYGWGEIKIKNQDLTAYYSQYEANEISANPNVEIQTYALPIDCTTRTHWIHNFNLSSKRKMKIEASLETESFLRANRYVARTRHYGKFFGLWKRRNADLYAGIYGTTGRNFCGGNEFIINESKAHYGSSVDVIFRVYDSGVWGDLRAQDNKIHSRHKVWNSNFKRKDYYDGQLFTY